MQPSSSTAAAPDIVTASAASPSPERPACRFCRAPLVESFADLGMMPLANAYRRPADLRRMEPFYPLHAYVCSQCFLVQLEALCTPEEIFEDYAYFSSFSESWLRHAGRFAAQAIEQFDLDGQSQVVEIASNDGYLLQYFQQRGIPVLGIEPAANVAAVASAKGIQTLTRFFGVETARTLAANGQQADLLVANNVLAHVPDINDFVAGLAITLRPSGVLSVEFPHLLNLIQQGQFDTIYHEHFSYLSFVAVERIFAAHGLALFDVEELPTHGGSLRIFARHRDSSGAISRRVGEMRARERGAGLDQIATYGAFAERIKTIKRGLLGFLVEAKFSGKRVVGYGAAAKGNTLLNYCGVRTDFLDYVVDISPHKQGLHLPGTQIPIHHPDRVGETRPDYLLVLPWNLKDEIMEQMSFIRDWGGRFVFPIPALRVMA
ncbi:class I SAM-dependent methyltransferase [Rhodospirillaceae bacterium SYSU D60014]|uniref:methyltransferase domain-containing protein n=1 Tax=Virgifigura deserti TaxID=2268457 RepID=UPI000E663F06